MCSAEGRAVEPKYNGASHSCSVPGRSLVHSVINDIEESPVIKLDVLDLRDGYGKFLVDTGADVNLIKLSALNDHVHIKINNAASITGVTATRAYTLGTCELELMGKMTLFHVVKTNFPITVEGILGRPFLRQEKSNVSFYHNALVTNSRPISPIPFIDPESEKSRKELAPEIKPIPRILRIKARTRQQVSIPLKTGELKEGYLPRIETPAGLFMGDSLVTNRNGSCQIYAINTLEKDITIEIPPQEIEPFEIAINKQNFDSLNYPDIQARIRELSEKIDSSHMNPEERSYLNKWISSGYDCFKLSTDKLSCTNLVKHRIPTTDEIPVKVKQYRQPPELELLVEEHTDKMYDDDILQASISPSNSPVIIVPKKADSQGRIKWRIVTDFRALNEKIVGDSYPLPLINTILERSGTAQYFSVLDLASGFHQIETEPRDRHKTAFSTRRGHHQYKRMPMGIKNAPATFQRMMDQLLNGMQYTELFVYLDDIIIFSRTLEEHDRTVERLFTRLRDANLVLQPEKCEFLRTEVTYLGHIVSKDGIRTNPKKVEAIQSFPTPKNVKTIREFLGIAGYYRRFIENFSSIAKPLFDLVKKNAAFKWGPEEEASFQNLKEKLCSDPILQYPDFEKPFRLTTDASEFAMGAVLTQNVNGIDLPVSYYSKTFNDNECKYPQTGRECLAVMYALENYRPYLYGRKFILSCDHEPIKWIDATKTPVGRLLKWLLQLQEYDYEFECKPGKLNRWLPALSENPIRQDSEDRDSVSSSAESDLTENESLTTPFQKSLKALPTHIRSLGIKILPLTPRPRAAKEAAKEGIRQSLTSRRERLHSAPNPLTNPKEPHKKKTIGSKKTPITETNPTPSTSKPQRISTQRQSTLPTSKVKFQFPPVRM